MITALQVFLVLLLVSPAYAEPLSEPDPPLPTHLPPAHAGAPPWLAELKAHTADELYALLQRVESLHGMGDVVAGDAKPVVFLLHGDEINALVKARYAEHKPLVDLAARLSAFELIDLQVCETWMQRHAVARGALQPFVSTVPFAPDQRERLLKQQNYSSF